MDFNRNLESLNEFRQRTNSFNQSSINIEGFYTNHNLINKINYDGKMAEFIGNTVVFNITDDIKDSIYNIQNKLYTECKDILAKPLSKETFHITLHDLISGKPSVEINNKIESIQKLALKLVNDISNIKFNIKLQSTFLFNMVNTSMVIGFEPFDDKSCKELMKYYEMFQSIVNLNYPLTPHVTVAYFKPSEEKIDKNWIYKIQEVIDFVKKQEKIEVTLTNEMLEYQLFSDMNNYYKI